MSMSKKDFIQLADLIKTHNSLTKHNGESKFVEGHLDTLIVFCRRQNPNFMENRWLNYIDGKCGPNGGEVKRSKVA